KEADPAAISRALMAREPEPPVPMRLLRATAKLADTLGGATPAVEPLKLGHDLQVFEIFSAVHGDIDPLPHPPVLSHMREVPTGPLTDDDFNYPIRRYVTLWRGEDYLKAQGARLGRYVPDAAIYHDGRILHAWDFGARYPIDRVGTMCR